MADVTNIKKVRFSSGSTEGYGEDLYAHDYGQILQFEGIDLPTAYEVHFGRCAFGEGVMQIGEAGQVRVPASFLEEPGVVFLWIHVHFTEDDGTTIYMARLNVLPKADATEEVTPEEESAFAQAIAALNHAVEKTGQDAEATTAAKDAALEAQRLAEEAKSAAETAQGKSEDAQAAAETSKRLAEEAKAAAETAASGASGSEEAAKEAQRLAETAKTASETAKTSAETAKTAAETAKRLAEEAKTAAETAKETAVGAAANAADAAGTAVNKAREADESARAAYNSADAAARSAQSASEAATAAAESVRTARDYANTARNWTDGKNLDGTDSTSHIGNNAKHYSEQAAQSATDANNAKQAVQNMTVSATPLAASATPTATKTTDQQTGVVNIEYGLVPGTTFTPSVSGDGTLSFTNDGNKTNPAAVNIAEQVRGVFDEIVTGTDPVIVGVGNHRYLCGEVATIDITPSATGVVDVIFTSGTTPAVLTLPSTVQMPDWFDATDLAAETVYEINIADGVWGAVMMWAS